jgi:hypoxanthine phosphoribosyltransferase
MLEPPVLLSRDEIAARVRELARAISLDYADVDELVLVGVLKGAFVFLADLAREIDLPRVVDFIALSSYGAGTVSSGAVRLIMDVRMPLEGRHVLIVEDIVDRGHTLRYLERLFAARRPASLATCALLRKPGCSPADLEVRYVGFDIPDVWVVGYGLDLDDRHRMLPYIGKIDAP